MVLDLVVLRDLLEGLDLVDVLVDVLDVLRLLLLTMIQHVLLLLLLQLNLLRPLILSYLYLLIVKDLVVHLDCIGWQFLFRLSLLPFVLELHSCLFTYL